MIVVIKSWKEISAEKIVFAEELGFDSEIDYNNKLVILRGQK